MTAAGTSFAFDLTLPKTRDLGSESEARYPGAVSVGAVYSTSYDSITSTANGRDDEMGHRYVTILF